jgi:hypothetical protein
VSKLVKARKAPTDESDAVWGVREIGRIINRNEQQVYYLAAHGMLGDAVVKVSHKLLLGSRLKLTNLTTVLAPKP